MAYAPWCPTFIYATSTTWRATLPARPWARKSATIGGARRSATGVLASYIVRRDPILQLTLRFYETEWEDIEALITYGQSGEFFLWYPDEDYAPAEFYSVDLDSPQAGMDLTPARTEFPDVLEVTIGLRRIDGLGWDDLQYFMVPE